MIRNKKFFILATVAVFVLGLGSVLLLNYSTDEYVIKFSRDDSTCINCHGAMSGMSPLHGQLECVSCHKGINTLADKDSSHRGLVKIPGNMVDAQETCVVCHAEAVERINQSLMTTNSGIIAVDKYIFSELSSPDSMMKINDVKHSMADEHLRTLCLRCHLGNDKNNYAPVDELTRGGGCNACHLNYSQEAKKQLSNYLVHNELPTVHPSLDLQISDDHCFGCHSRSGRISTNYQGFHETLLKANEVSNWDTFKQLKDERVFKYIKEDIHHERGLACIDCHGYEDVMGDGNSYSHKEEAVKISCEDCHDHQLKTISLARLPFAEQRIFKIRQLEHGENHILITKKDSVPIINGYLDEKGNGHLMSKLDHQVFELQPPTSSCTRGFGHDNLTCTSCHTSWAPQCIGCHVTYDRNTKGYDLLDKKEVPGTWVEYAGSFLQGPPTLGVRNEGENKGIVPAIPGMILTLDKSSFGIHAMPADANFYRLFAPASPHTISAMGRTCTSCHNNPLAIGYGRGKLTFSAGSEGWKWKFNAEYEALSQDGLPADAWIGFLNESNAMNSTHTNFRPFSVSEQERILRVGACLTCHKGDSEVMKNSLTTNFDTYLKKISPYCKIPEFD